MRGIIEDNAERYKKIVWLDSINGNKLKDQFHWAEYEYARTRCKRESAY
jgi:hypothetical protein